MPFTYFVCVKAYRVSATVIGFSAMPIVPVTVFPFNHKVLIPTENTEHTERKKHHGTYVNNTEI
ncbi:MAG: hypothetical protein MJ102_09355, partial [Clostridia bacterium]|nr:hypothetical protein [Clostridia bacterium]